MTEAKVSTDARLSGLGSRWGAVPAGALPAPRAKVLAARGALSEAVGGRVSFSDFDRLSYARDLWPLALLWIRQGRVPPPPDAIVWPGTEDEVARLICVARDKHLGLIPYGAGSGVCGGTWAIHGGVSLDLKRFDSIGPVDEARRCVDVGAGVMGETLERKLNFSGWTLGHFPSSIYCSSVGGWIAARSAGQLSSRYGKIEDMVLSLRAVLGTGEQLITPERPFSGPDLAPLLIGSEGTLCAFTGARLRVFPLPEGRVFHGFEFASVETGLEAIRLVFREGLRPAVVRLYDPFDTAFVGKGRKARHAPVTPPSQRSAMERSFLPMMLRQVTKQTLGRPKVVNQLQRMFHKSRLILMFEGDAKRAEADDRAATMLCRKLGGDDLGEAPGRAWLARRYDVSYRMSRLIDAGTFADTMEIAAPWERVHEVYERVHAAASPYAFVLCHFSHAYADGCSLYFSFVGSGGDEQEIEQRYHQLWRAALAAAVSAGGNVSHHHGVGLLKAQALQDALGDGRHALAALKALFDPDGVMNPGKLGLSS
ncbi:MAG: dehydrogenase [Myxococcaceae bacterium]